MGHGIDQFEVGHTDDLLGKGKRDRETQEHRPPTQRAGRWETRPAARWASGGRGKTSRGDGRSAPATSSALIAARMADDCESRCGYLAVGAVLKPLRSEALRRLSGSRGVRYWQSTSPCSGRRRSCFRRQEFRLKTPPWKNVAPHSPSPQCPHLFRGIILQINCITIRSRSPIALEGSMLHRLALHAASGPRNVIQRPGRLYGTVETLVLPRIPEPEPCERGAVRGGKPTRTKIRTAALRDLA